MAVSLDSLVYMNTLMYNGRTQAVDMWSIGVIIYTLLGGYPPFHDENQTRLFRRVKAGSFKFHDEYWSNTSEQAKVRSTRVALGMCVRAVCMCVLCQLLSCFVSLFVNFWPLVSSIRLFI